jgi:hypothetical protein
MSDLPSISRAPPLLSPHSPPPLPAWGQALAKAGEASIAQRTRAHSQAIEQRGVGLYYGTRSEFSGLNPMEQAKWLRAQGVMEKRPVRSDCIRWSMEHLEKAYIASGRAERWKHIEAEVLRHGTRGDVLAKQLQKDGWSAWYWNPDTRPSAGPEHAFTAQAVARGGPYYGISLDGALLDYARPGRGERVLQGLRQAPFFFGMAEGGKHTFVGHRGSVSEFHWAAEPTDPQAMEETPLERFDWGSGVLLVPPGPWMEGGKR